MIVVSDCFTSLFETLLWTSVGIRDASFDSQHLFITVLGGIFIIGSQYWVMTLPALPLEG